MNKLASSWVAAVSGILLALLSASAAWAERRVALIIGNSQYKNPSLVLFNPKNDAADVAASLRALGFEVIVKIDAGKLDFDQAMAQFARLATLADTALFYYAGHALQYHGQNYLMPTDADLVDDISLRYQMVSLDDVRDGLSRAGGVKIMILDACRNNPLIDRLRGRTETRDVGIVRGLARIDRAEGEVVAYATAANQVAADGSGRNSPFTTALLKRLGEAGLEIGTMFRRIAADVNDQTKGQQRPELLISLTGDYYLNQNDGPVWERIMDTTDPAAFRDFINRFPSSRWASDARYRLQLLERLGRLEVEPPQQRLTSAPTIPQPSPPIALEDACKRDDERLLRLRANPSRDEVIRFEHELGCERLRPQVARLRESIFAEGERDQREGAQGSEAEQLRPTPDLGRQKPQSDGVAQFASAPISQEQICQRDQERLLRLRASPARDEVFRFEGELGCERLRPQVDRLRESVSVQGERDDGEAAERARIEERPPTADAEQQEPKSGGSAWIARRQDSRVDDQPDRQARPPRRLPDRRGFQADLARSRRPDPPGLHFSFPPFNFFDANRHDAR
jgi:hypothetical protein